MNCWLRKRVAGIWLAAAPASSLSSKLFSFGSEIGKSETGAAAAVGATGVAGALAMKACRGVESVAVATEESSSAAARLAESSSSKALGVGSHAVSDVGELPGIGNFRPTYPNQAPLITPRPPLIVPHIGIAPLVEDGNGSQAVAHAVSHEPVQLVDASGRPIETQAAVTERAQLAYRQRAATILDQALSEIPPAEWKSPDVLRTSITQALKAEPDGSYAFDVTSGKLTLKTKVGKMEVSGEMNLYRAAARAAKGAGFAGASSYSALNAHRFISGAGYWLGNDTTEVQDPRKSSNPEKPAAPSATAIPGANTPESRAKTQQ